MNIEDENEEPFMVRDLWRPSRFEFHELIPLELLACIEETNLDTEGPFKNPLESLRHDGSFLFQLNVFGSRVENPDEENGTNETGSEASNRVGDSEAGSIQGLNEYGSIWDLEKLYREVEAKPTLHSWDGFLNPEFQEPASAYLSEFGAKGFDAALVHRATVNGLENSGRPVRSDVFLHSLFLLGFGWNSMFFHYNEKLRVFEKSFKDIRVTGISLPSIDGMINDVSACGTDIKVIRTFLRVNPTLSNQPLSLSSLASATSNLITNLEEQLIAQFNHDSSLIHMQWLFRQCGSLLNVLASLIAAVDCLCFDSDIISAVVEKCDASVQQYPWMADILCELVCRSTRPWLDLIETWIGLRAETPSFVRLIKSKNSFVEIESINDLESGPAAGPENEYIYNPSKMPSVLPAHQGHGIFETGKSLRLLTRTQPDHPLTNTKSYCISENLTLDCAFTWHDIESIQRKAMDYEKRLRSEILRYNIGAPFEIPFTPQRGETPSDTGIFPDVDTTIDCFKLVDLDQAADQAETIIQKCTSLKTNLLHEIGVEHKSFNSESLTTSQYSFGPPLSAAFYLSLAPILAVQARLLDYSCVRLLFKQHNLRHHLNLQWRFQLLADGYFSTRLSHCLFDEEMTSAERKSGITRGGINSGLRLGSRDNWPPASSELRLVLMGLLSECYNNHKHRQSNFRRGAKGETGNYKADKTTAEVLGDISFAIREISGSELDKCKDPNAIEALDFLRLQYKPHWELECVITSGSLRKYDRIFRHLLRLKRIVAVTQSFIRDVTNRGSLVGDTRNTFQKFRVDSHHFIMCLNEYTYQTVIGSTWRDFDQTLMHIERYLDDNDIDGAIGVVGSLRQLRDTHELVLDKMLFALLLSRQHEKAYALLMECFTTILTFAPLSRLDGREGVRSRQNEKMAYQFHAMFRKQVSTFLRYLRSLEGISGKSSPSSRPGPSATSFRNQDRSENLFQHLVLMLSLKEYY